MVRISVIIPCYNVEEYLKECLNSVVNQTFEDIEIICINDGSTDSTLAILEEYQKQDSRIRIITQENKGLGASRNVGLNNMNGEYVYFIDSDDYLERTALEELYDISSEKDLDLLIFKLINFNDETGEMDYNYSNMPFLAKFGENTFSFKDIKEDLLRIDVTVYTKFFKRELVCDIRFDENLLFEDNLFFIDYIFKAKRAYFYDKCLYYRRVRTDSIITSGNKKHTDVIEIFNKSIEKVKSFGYYGEFKEKLFMRKVDAIYYRYTLVNPKFKEFFFSKINEDFTSKQDEYEKELDFSKIDNKNKAIFRAGISSGNSKEFELAIRNYNLNVQNKKSDDKSFLSRIRRKLKR